MFKNHYSGNPLSGNTLTAVPSIANTGMNLLETCTLGTSRNDVDARDYANETYHC